MKTHRLAISAFSDPSSLSDTFLTYTLPNKEAILDFYTSRDFSLILSTSGELWEIGSFIRNSQSLLEYHSLHLNLSITSISCNSHCALLLTQSGRIYGWGHSETGIFFTHTTLSTPSLLPNFDLKRINDIQICNTYACSLDDQGNSYIWGSFKYLNLAKSIFQLTSYKDYTVKQIRCKDDFLCVCTDGGFVYFAGKIGSHSKVEWDTLSSFEALEGLCVINIELTEISIGVITDMNEVFVFDGCCVLTQVECSENINWLVSTRDVLIGIGLEFIYKWFVKDEDCEKYTKEYCPLKFWQGKMFKLGVGPVINAKGGEYGFGVTLQCLAGEKVESTLISNFVAGCNRGKFKMIIENDQKSAVDFMEIVGRIFKRVQQEGFDVVRKEALQKKMISRMIQRSTLPLCLAEVYEKYCRRCYMIGVFSIKNELKAQDLIARERIKIVRSSTMKRNENLMKMKEILSHATHRNLIISARFVLKILHKISELHLLKHNISHKIASILLKLKLKHFFKSWTSRLDLERACCSTIISFLKHAKHSLTLNTFLRISSYSTYLKFNNQKRSQTLQRLLKLYSHKYFKLHFNLWKNEYLKLKAHQLREFKTYQLSVKLGCKYLFPIILSHILGYWSLFKSISLQQIKIRYRHFALFLTYFMKKKSTSHYYFVFSKLSRPTPSVSISQDADSSLYTASASKASSSNIFSFPIVHSLNMAIDSYKRQMGSALNSPKVPKLLLSMTPSNKSRYSSSQSTIRPPWKPASGSSSRVTTPKATKKSENSQKQNKCLRSLNILPKSKRTLKKSSLNKSVDNKGKIGIGLTCFTRAYCKIEFKHKFSAFSVIKFY